MRSRSNARRARKMLRFQDVAVRLKSVDDQHKSQDETAPGQNALGLKGLAVVQLDVRGHCGLKTREKAVNSLVEGVTADS